MIIFTEHNEVIVNVPDLRTIIRIAVRVGYRMKDEDIPVDFAAESTVKAIEEEIRKNKDLMNLLTIGEPNEI